MIPFFKKKTNHNRQLAAVASGKCIPMEEVNDPVFSAKTLGEGVAIIPEDGEIVAPCDGTLSMVAQTSHAFGMTGNDGLELMVHVGIDTVSLNGEGFEVLAAEGSRVSKGQPIIRFDQAFMREKQIDMTTMLILLNHENYHIVRFNDGQTLKKGVDAAIEYSE